jgi:uncharacterized protein
MAGSLLYEDYQQIIDEDGAEFSVAEAHGLMTGMLCVDQSASFDQWENEMRSTGILADYFNREALDCMTALFEGTRNKFADGGFEFSPCLPDDDYTIAERARALSEWCQGFLQGLGHANVKRFGPGQCTEVISDLIAISDVDPNSNDEDDEDSLMELIEYVRVGVELIRIELQAMYDPRKVH